MKYSFSAASRLMMITLMLSMTGAASQAQFGISEKQEMEAGKQADAQVRQQYHISTDRTSNNLVRYLGTHLTKVCDRPSLPWTFRVIDSKEINAFSVPGYVYVNTALINLIGSDQDALAGVIAHEIGHTCGRHAVKQMEKSTVASLLGSLIGGRSRNVSALVNVAGNLVMLGYSRNDEYDADRRAVKYTLKAGYDPEGLVRFFNLLETKVGKGGGGIATYFQTHPATPDRIQRVQQEIRKDRAAGIGR